MRTTYSNRASRPYLRSPKTFLLGFFLAVILSSLLLWRDAAAGLLLRLFSPINAARDALSASEVARLQAELASTTALIADRTLLYQENIDLKSRLGRVTHAGRTLAGVIARPPGIPYDTLIIDAGAQEGIAKGDIVSAGGSALIGEVVQVYPTTSRVELFSAPGRTYEGLLHSSFVGVGYTPVTVSGQGGGSLVAQVPAGTLVSSGDAIVLPGVAGGITSTVSAVISVEGESFKTLYLHLPANPLALRYVEVIASQ